VDFVVVGEADCTGGLSFADISSSLLNHNPTRAQVRPVVMTSNNAKAQDFYLRHATGTLCSAALTSRDIAWMERTSGLKTGALFKAFKQATAAGAPTVSELSWEPTERWGQLPREVRRSQRGEKSAAHLENLRRSDPLINAWAWRDSREELRRVEASPLARLNQQARILRGMAEHRLLTRLLLERLDKGEAEEEGEVAKVAEVELKRKAEVEAEVKRKAGRPGLHERASNDTVLDIELGLGTNNNNHNLDSLDDLDLELGWGNQAGFVKPQLEQGDYSPKSVVPSEPSFAPEQTKAQLGEGMGNGMYLEADGSFGYSLTSS